MDEDVEFLPPVQVARRMKRWKAWMTGPSAATRRTTGLGMRSRISDEESGSKLAESEVVAVVLKDVDGMRDDEVTSEGGAGETAVSFSFFTGVADEGDVVDDDMAARPEAGRVVSSLRDD